MLLVIPWKAFFIALMAGLFRNIFGWLENALEDLKPGMKWSDAISPYEWGQLGATITRVLIMTIAVYLPLNAFGVDAAELAAVGSALVMDFVLKAVKKQKLVVEEPD
jgi:hypothetical protein